MFHDAYKYINNYVNITPHAGMYDTLLKFKSTRNEPEGFLHKDYVSFLGYHRANGVIEQYYEGDNWGPLPAISDSFALGFNQRLTMKFCPYGATTAGTVANQADMTAFLQSGFFKWSIFGLEHDRFRSISGQKRDFVPKT